MVSRRTLVHGAVWSAPVVLSTSHIPAYSASLHTPQSEGIFSFPTVASSSGFSSSDVNPYTGKPALSTCLPASQGEERVCPAGRTITSLGVSPQGTLTPAYGDWNANVDSFSSVSRVYLSTYTPNGSEMGVSQLAGSEALSPMRTHAGITYTATFDPSNRPVFGAGVFATSGHGMWEFIPVPESSSQVHIFDTDFSGDEPIIIGQDSASRGIVYADSKRVYTHSSRLRDCARYQNFVFSVSSSHQIFRTDMLSGSTELWYSAPNSLGTIQELNPYFLTSRYALDLVTRTRIPMSVRAGVSNNDSTALVLTNDGLLYNLEGVNKSLVAHVPSIPSNATSFALFGSYLFAGDNNGFIHRIPLF